jgi:uncharacterized protein YbjT (DUF2867 family)
MLAGLFTGAIVKYLVIASVAFGALAWIRHDAAAPYRKEVTALRAAAKNKERLEQQDAARAEIDRFEHAREKAELEKIIEESRNPGAWRGRRPSLERAHDPGDR